MLGALAGAREKEAGGFRSVTGERVADGLLKILLEGRIVIGEADEKRIPKLGGGLGIVVERDELGEIVVGLVGGEFARREIESAIEEIEEVGVRVEGGMRQSDAGEEGGEAEEGSETRERGAAFDMAEDTFAEVGVFAVEGGSELVARIERRGGESEDVIVVEEPAGAIEEKPAPGGDEADERAELLDEAAGVAAIGEIVCGESHESDALIVGWAILWLMGRERLGLFLF
jgi:hypothetical protein